MNIIRFGDAWRVVLQTADTSGNAQAPDAEIQASDVRVYVNGTLSVTAVTVTTLGDIVGGHLISWPNDSTSRGDHLRMQVAFQLDSQDYEFREEALVEITPYAESASGSFALDSFGALFNSTKTKVDSLPLATQVRAEMDSNSTQLAAAVTQATTAATQAAQAVLNSAAAASNASAAAADALTANTQTKATAIRAAMGLDAADLTTVLDTITASAAASATAAAAVQELVESDQILEDVSGVRKLKFYRKGTSVELITAKTAKQPDGSDLTDPSTERLAGYRE